MNFTVSTLSSNASGVLAPPNTPAHSVNGNQGLPLSVQALADSLAGVVDLGSVVAEQSVPEAQHQAESSPPVPSEITVVNNDYYISDVSDGTRDSLEDFSDLL